MKLQNNGMILLSVLLFLSMITMLLLNVFSDTIIETKINHGFYAKSTAYQEALSGIAIMMAKIKGLTISNFLPHSQLSYQMNQLNDLPCFYRDQMISVANYANAEVKLIVIIKVVKIPVMSPCQKSKRHIKIESWQAI